MSGSSEESESQGRDTSPLRLSQLSEYELRIIREIEDRLQEAPAIRRTSARTEPLDYCQKTQLRDPRVLLMDGGRGSGKTSLLLTMADWWRSASRDPKYYQTLNTKRKARLAELGLELVDIPDNIRVLRIIDFDPLPPGMPLIAGIVQAWKPVAKYFDSAAGQEPSDGLLMDDWESLFAVATVGWTTIGGGKGLIDQVLDREEQVNDWYEVVESWQRFVGKVINRGHQLERLEPPSLKPVFVIMIDDVDLQVRRIRELLPALRVLYHPNVFFIVAGDREHMADMLELDFQGQQRKLGAAKLDGQASGRFDRWPRILADAAFQKVFSFTHIWKLERLGLRELLAFSNLKTSLNKWQSSSEKLGAHQGLGDYLDRIDSTGSFFDRDNSSAPELDNTANIPEKSGANGTFKDTPRLGLPAIMPYRRAHQLSELVKIRQPSRNTALKLVEQMIQGDGSESQINLGRPGNEGEGKLEYLTVGELGAIYPKVFGVDIDAGKEIILSGRPQFAFRDGISGLFTSGAADQGEHWRHLFAASLSIDGFGLLASGLRWDVYLALAWTRVQLPEGLELAFWWRLHLLLSPIRFAAWSRDWAGFIQQLSVRVENTSGEEDKSSQIERIAYGWIYYQLYWMTKNLSHDVAEPLDAKIGKGHTNDWDKLLAQEPDPAFLRGEHDYETGTWKNRTLALLARPELFLPPHIQDLLLRHIDTSKTVIDDLRKRRTKLVTDAVRAARYPIHSDAKGLSVSEVAAVEKNLNSEYERFYDTPSPWVKSVDARRIVKRVSTARS